MKSYHGKMSANFHDNGMSKEGFHCVFFWLVKLINSVLNLGKNYYIRGFLEECEYATRKNTMRKFINDELEISSDEEAFDEKQIKTEYHDSIFYEKNFDDC